MLRIRTGLVPDQLASVLRLYEEALRGAL